MKKVKIYKTIFVPYLFLGILPTSAIAPIVMSSCGEQSSKQGDEQGSEQTFVPVTDVKLDNDKLELTVDSEPKQLTATVWPKNATNKNVTWSSDNLKVATVDKNGIVEVFSIGDAIITAKTKDGYKTATCRVIVRPVAVKNISLPNELTIGLNKNNSCKLTATISPDNATNKNVTWISSNRNIATVDENGLVTAVNEGGVGIWAITKDGEHKASCMVYITEEADEIENDQLDKEKLELQDRDGQQLTAKIEPENTTNKRGTWKSGTTITKDGEHKITCTVVYVM